MGVESALVVPVPSAGNVVRLLRRVFDPTARDGLPPHVTVLGPFRDPADLDAAGLAELAAAVGSVRSFAYRLSRIGWFDDRVVYLAPEPAEGFIQLTEAVVRRFPDHLPYGGAFGSSVPHLSIGIGGPAPALRVAARLVAPRLPIDAVASNVQLMSHEPGRRPWRVDREFALG